MGTVTDRREAEKKQKLELIQSQVKEGTLVIRKMTREEREKYPPLKKTKGGPKVRSRKRYQIS